MQNIPAYLPAEIRQILVEQQRRAELDRFAASHYQVKQAAVAEKQRDYYISRFCSLLRRLSMELADQLG
jgi:ribosomal protein S19E (S16A)